MPKSEIQITEYNEFVRSVDLLTIRLDKLKADFPGAYLSLQKPPVIAVKSNATYKEVDKGAIDVTASYSIVATAVEGKKEFLKISCAFVLRYRAKKPLTPTIWKVFKARNVPLNTWPYFREIVQNLVARFGLPPLTLPSLQV